jgi:aspartyl/asparaginyl-tRNA synthetase
VLDKNLKFTNWKPLRFREKFPIQTKNKPSLDYLREMHLRVRTNMFGAIMRCSVYHLRAQLFSKKDLYMYTPIITGSDAEGVKCLKLQLYHLTEHQEPREK